MLAARAMAAGSAVESTVGSDAAGLAGSAAGPGRMATAVSDAEVVVVVAVAAAAAAA